MNLEICDKGNGSLSTVSGVSFLIQVNNRSYPFGITRSSHSRISVVRKGAQKMKFLAGFSFL